MKGQANGNPHEGLLKISALAEAAGVSKQTIHYYLREGILAPPVKNSRNMAYYGRQHVEELRLIKDLQEQRYLPLAVIKGILENRRRGGDMHHSDHLDLMQRLFAPGGEEQANAVETWTSQEKLLENSGLAPQDLEAMAALGLVAPRQGESGCELNGIDAALLVKTAALMEMGLRAEDLQLYARLLQLMREEINLAHDRIIHNPASANHHSLADIENALEGMRAQIMLKAYREYFISHNPGRTEKGGLADD